MNSPGTRYQVAPSLLKLARDYGSPGWADSLKGFLRTAQALRRLQPRERHMSLIPVRLPDGREVGLTAGGQNEVVQKIVEAYEAHERVAEVDGVPRR